MQRYRILSLVSPRPWFKPSASKSPPQQEPAPSNPQAFGVPKVKKTKSQGPFVDDVIRLSPGPAKELPPGDLHLHLDLWKSTVLGTQPGATWHQLGCRLPDLEELSLLDLSDDLLLADWSRIVAALSLGHTCASIPFHTKKASSLGYLGGKECALHLLLLKPGALDQVLPGLQNAGAKSRRCVLATLTIFLRARDGQLSLSRCGQLCGPREHRNQRSKEPPPPGPALSGANPPSSLVKSSTVSSARRTRNLSDIPLDWDEENTHEHLAAKYQRNSSSRGCPASPLSSSIGSPSNIGARKQNRLKAGRGLKIELPDELDQSPPRVRSAAATPKTQGLVQSPGPKSTRCRTWHTPRKSEGGETPKKHQSCARNPDSPSCAVTPSSASGVPTQAGKGGVRRVYSTPPTLVPSELKAAPDSQALPQSPGYLRKGRWSGFRRLSSATVLPRDEPSPSTHDARRKPARSKLIWSAEEVAAPNKETVSKQGVPRRGTEEVSTDATPPSDELGKTKVEGKRRRKERSKKPPAEVASTEEASAYMGRLDSWLESTAACIVADQDSLKKHSSVTAPWPPAGEGAAGGACCSSIEPAHVDVVSGGRLLEKDSTHGGPLTLASTPKGVADARRRGADSTESGESGEGGGTSVSSEEAPVCTVLLEPQFGMRSEGSEEIDELASRESFGMDSQGIAPSGAYFERECGGKGVGAPMMNQYNVRGHHAHQPLSCGAPGFPPGYEQPCLIVDLT